MFKKKSKKQEVDKFKPLPEKEYMITDQCFWEQNPPENYNPLDSKRTPHSVTLVDVENGSITLLPSGSIIKVISAKAVVKMDKGVS